MQYIVPRSTTLTLFTCQSVLSGSGTVGTTTFTLRVNRSDVATCVTSGGTAKAQTISQPVSAGDLVSVFVQSDSRSNRYVWWGVS